MPSTNPPSPKDSQPQPDAPVDIFETLDLDQLADELLAFADVPKYRSVEETVISKDGIPRAFTKEVPQAPPLLSEFARRHGMTAAELEEAALHSPKLGRALMLANAIVKEFMVTHGLLGGYNAAFATFAATNLTDMRDKREVDVRRVNIFAKLKEIEEEGDPLIPIPEQSVSLKEFKDAAKETTILSKKTRNKLHDDLQLVFPGDHVFDSQQENGVGPGGTQEP